MKHTLRHFFKSLRLRLPERVRGWVLFLSFLVNGSPCIALLLSAICALLLFCTTLNFAIWSISLSLLTALNSTLKYIFVFRAFAYLWACGPAAFLGPGLLLILFHKCPNFLIFFIITTIVFRSGSVQDPCSWFWPGRSGQCFFFKIKTTLF